MCNTQLFHNKTLSFPSCPKAPPESKSPQSGASGHIALHLSRMADRLPGACLLSPASQRMQPHIHRRPSSVTGQLHWLASCSSTYPSTGSTATRSGGSGVLLGYPFYMNWFITKDEERRWKQGGLNVQTSEGKCKIVSLNVTG